MLYKVNTITNYAPLLTPPARFETSYMNKPHLSKEMAQHVNGVLSLTFVTDVHHSGDLSEKQRLGKNPNIAFVLT